MKIIPALLTDTAADLFGQIERLKPYYSQFQIDIADGRFVPNTTVQIPDLVKELDKTGHKFGSEITFDFHLMVQDWQTGLKQIDDISSYVTIDIVFVHFGVVRDTIDELVKPGKYTIGIVLNPEDDGDDLLSVTDIAQFPAIQAMTVNPGFQGSPFIEESLNKIDRLREQNYNGSIYIDGGVNNKTLPVIQQRRWQPDYLGIGSFLSKADNIEERVAYLREFER